MSNWRDACDASHAWDDPRPFAQCDRCGQMFRAEADERLCESCEHFEIGAGKPADEAPALESSSSRITPDGVPVIPVPEF